MEKLINPLPIDKYQQIIEESIEKNPITIITAETGAGKSTRVPLWLWKKGKKVHITQPRRIATRSLSYYLSQITSTKWGRQVGYQTGFDRKYSKETTFLYLTDGVQMIQEIKNQHNYDILIIDEIHEWNLNQEVLIGLVKSNLKKNNYFKTGKRIVVMSATLQSEKLSAFFDKAPIISVSGRGFPVSMFFNHPHFLLSDTVQMVEMEKNSLVFQPGKKEIEEFIRSLKETLEHDKKNAVVLPLHSELSIKEQSKVFRHYKIPKVVVSTDIAQTSLTIDDIDAVIDTGIKKEIRNIKGIEGLYPVNISHSECMQRAGRAGRVKIGQYILCAELDINDRHPFPEPELRRLNLESVALRFIKWGISPLDFPYFHSPKKNLIYKAIEQLKNFGAISEEEEITADGDRMAEFPVSIRSARLLIEANKGSKQVLDNSLKLIAILETKGIVNKEYMGEKYHSGPLNSDLLNQLNIWNSEKINKKIISYKKLSMAKEIYRELKNRININKLAASSTPKDVNILFRAILSTFIDYIYIKMGNIYIRENEERQLDRNSILSNSMPEMLTGMPFDLVVNWENEKTGEKEKKHIPLITFATEISLKLLEELKPFSYRKEKEIKLENNKVCIRNEIFFGGKSIAIYGASPDWDNYQEKTQVIKAVLKWYEDNKGKYALQEKKEKLKKYFFEVKKIIKKELKPFDFYWKKFLNKELKNFLKTEDLDLFFKFHHGFKKLTLKELLPYSFIKDLKKAQWPEQFEINGKVFKIFYIKNIPFTKPEINLFEKMKEEDLILPTGERAGVILNSRKFRDWEYAVYFFNNNKKVEIFEKKWKNLKNSPIVDDIIGIPFPQAFMGGSGKKNIKFEYYTVPQIEGDKVFLIHFFDKDKAQLYFDTIKQKWELWIQNYKKQKLENIFKQKGWKVKT